MTIDGLYKKNGERFPFKFNYSELGDGTVVAKVDDDAIVIWGNDPSPARVSWDLTVEEDKEPVFLFDVKFESTHDFCNSLEWCLLSEYLTEDQMVKRAKKLNVKEYRKSPFCPKDGWII